ncbi:hypothetical protein MNBD_NITROSPINAE05-876 [hydrothermal vent metagenome]|uniref:PRC-barrel domain-containing protein n=1 Tax=hydrothermal vent metagenome TaxID=652676 RepID=A0A3B1DGI2_9ZZZZ
MSSGRLVLVTENIHKLRQQDRIIGCYLYDEFDEAVSRVEALMVENGTLLPRYLLITLGGALNVRGKKILLPVEHCQSVDLGKVKTSWRRESLLKAPTAHDPHNPTMAEEERILDYFDLKPYWSHEPAEGTQGDPDT